MTVAIKDRIDPVTFEVLRSLFEYTCTRMASVLQKSSFSPILAEMVDFPNAIYDADLQLPSQSANCPVHVTAMKELQADTERIVRKSVEAIPGVNGGQQSPIQRPTRIGADDTVEVNGGLTHNGHGVVIDPNSLVLDEAETANAREIRRPRA